MSPVKGVLLEWHPVGCSVFGVVCPPFFESLSCEPQSPSGQPALFPDVLLSTAELSRRSGEFWMVEPLPSRMKTMSSAYKRGNAAPFMKWSRTWQSMFKNEYAAELVALDFGTRGFAEALTKYVVANAAAHDADMLAKRVGVRGHAARPRGLL